MSVHVPSPTPPSESKPPTNWLFDLITAGEASFDFSLLARLPNGPQPELDGFAIAFALSPAQFQE